MDLKNGMVIKCNSEEEAQEFIKEAYKQGFEWVNIDGTDWIDYIEVLTLDEIVEQAREKVSDDYIRENGLMITVFIEGPLEGKILQYGNYGNSWWQIAKTSGYA